MTGKYLKKIHDISIIGILVKNIIMEIGQKVLWKIDEKINKGLFLQIIDDNKAEVICYSMNDIKCQLTVFVELSKLQLDNS